MVTNDENVLKLKHKVIEEVARLAWKGDFDEENYERITYKLIPGPRATYRCCIYKERELIRQLAGLPEEIHLSARDLDPSRINKYVTELAARFHKFYTVCRIRDAEPELLSARLLLADCVRRVIAISLGIIGVSAPEKM